LIDIKQLHNKQINKLRQYFFQKAKTSKLHEAITKADDKYTPLNLINNIEQPITTLNNKIEGWMAKELHGRYPQQLREEHINRKASTAWTKYGYLFPETEGFMVAIQDQ